MENLETPVEKIENKKENRFVHNAAQTAVLMAILTLVSKLFGFVREMVMAGFFGTSYITDAYVMAQNIPGILFTGIFSAVATAYMPLFSKRMEEGGQEKGNKFTSKVLQILFVAAAFSALVGILFSNQLTTIFARGFEGETASLTSSFLKVTFSYAIFSATAGILEAYLQYKNTFLPQIVVGYTQNIILIATIIFSAFFGHYYLAYGLLIAYVIRLILMWILARKKDFRYVHKTGESKEIVRQIIILALPVFIGSCVSQINIFVDKFLASGLPEGSVSALNYASILNSTIMGLSVTLLTTMIYPKLTQASAAGDGERLNSLIQKGFNVIVMIAVPFSLGAMVYSNQLVQVIYERGAFDMAATDLTGSAYFCYSMGMTFMALNVLFSNIYYSKHDTRTPMIFAAIGVIINIVLNLALVGPFQHSGLAFATSVAAVANSAMFLLGIKKKHNDIRVIESVKKLALIVLMAVIAVGVSVAVYAFLATTIWMPRLVYLGLSVCAAMAMYLVLLKVCKIEELNFLKALVKR